MTTDPAPGEVRAARVRADARERLARELHDEVTHRVATISLQVMGHRSSDDTAQLRGALDNISEVTADLLGHVWLLDRVLRAHPFDPGAPGPAAAVEPGLTHLAVCDPVPVLVAREVGRLEAAGIDVDTELPDSSAGEVGPLARRTLEDALAVGRAHLVGHTTPGARCRIEVTVAAGSVLLRITASSSLEPGPEVGDDLAGLDERVRLIEGRLRIGSLDDASGGRWSLVLRVRDR